MEGKEEGDIMFTVPTYPVVVLEPPPDLVVVHLVERGVITSTQASLIRSQSSDLQVSSLCRTVMGGPDRGYYELINTLRDTGHEKAAVLLPTQTR